VKAEREQAEVRRLGRRGSLKRKQARKKYEGALDALASALEWLPTGSWTMYDDPAEPRSWIVPMSRRR
jgi:hypothetical protein